MNPELKQRVKPLKNWMKTGNIVVNREKSGIELEAIDRTTGAQTGLKQVLSHSLPNTIWDLIASDTCAASLCLYFQLY